MRRTGAAVIALLVGYGLLELAVLLVVSPDATVPANMAAPVAPVAPDDDMRAARERAGLGFRDPMTALHPYLGYVYLPKSEHADPDAIGLAISDQGFLHAGSSLKQRGEGRLVIGVTGGSVAGQLGAHYGQHLLDALAAQPELAGLQFDMVWLGMPGYHQPQQAIQLSWLLAQGGEFDAFVNIDGFNEIAVGPVLNVPKGAHPLFPMNWSMVALDTPDAGVRRAVGAIDHLNRERQDRAATFADSAWSWSPTAKWLRDRDDRGLRQRIAEYERELAAVNTDEVPWFVSGPRDDHLELEALVLEGVAVWERGSRQLDALCRANGIHYVHVMQPNQYDPGSKPLSSTESESAYDEESRYRPAVELGYPALRAAGERLVEDGVDFRDLSFVFDGVDETLYTDVCCHFNAEGNRLMAAEIAAAVGAAVGS